MDKLSSPFIPLISLGILATDRSFEESRGDLCVRVCSTEKLQIAIEIEIESDFERDFERERVEFDDKFCRSCREFSGMGAFCFGCVGCMQRGF